MSRGWRSMCQVRYVLGDSDGHVLSWRLPVEAKLRGRKVTRHLSLTNGVHGNDRLGGDSLLDCVVYARVAGAACAKYVLGVSDGHVSRGAIAGGGRVEGSKSDQAIVGDGGWAEMSAAGVDGLR